MLNILQEYKRGSKFGIMFENCITYEFNNAQDLWSFKEYLREREEVGLTEDELSQLVEAFD